MQKLATKICKEILVNKRIEQLSVLKSRFDKFDLINVMYNYNSLVILLFYILANY